MCTYVRVFVSIYSSSSSLLWWKTKKNKMQCNAIVRRVAFYSFADFPFTMSFKWGWCIILSMNKHRINIPAIYHRISDLHNHNQKAKHTRKFVLRSDSMGSVSVCVWESTERNQSELVCANKKYQCILKQLCVVLREVKQ